MSELIEEDPRSAELIKPWLRGKEYQAMESIVRPTTTLCDCYIRVVNRL